MLTNFSPSPLVLVYRIPIGTLALRTDTGVLLGARPIVTTAKAVEYFNHGGAICGIATS